MVKAPISVSVIIRTKNRPDLLKTAVESVITQQHRPLELVVINDGGDDIQNLLHQWLAGSDLSLNYSHFKESQGRSNAANAGLNAATSPFCIFLDDDDYFDAEHISSLVAAHLEHFGAQPEKLGVTHSQARAVHFGESQSEEQLLSLQGRAFQKNELFYQNILPILTVLLPTRVRELGVQFDSAFDLFEDWDFWLQVNQLCEFHVVERASCAYRIHPQSSGVREQERKNAAYLQIYRKWLGQRPAEFAYQLIIDSHLWHDATVARLQDQNHQRLKAQAAEIERMGLMHTHALETIANKDRDIEHLTQLFETVEKRLNLYLAESKITRRTSLFYIMKRFYQIGRAWLKNIFAREH